MGVLERGGNAFDAAVAGGFVLQIVEPHLNGPGGEVPLMIWSERDRRMRVLCGQGPAPALATPEYFRKCGLELVPGIGLLPATVPGAFGAWLTMLRDYGTWSLADVLQPAIEYAQFGFPLVARAIQSILAVESLLRSEWKTSGSVWLPNGKVPVPDTLFCNPGVANTYARIIKDSAERGRLARERQIDAAIDIWYRGFVATEIDRFYRNEVAVDTTGRRNGGLLRYADMASWSARYEDPVTADYGHYTVAKCGAWSQGPVFLQQLTMLRHAGLERMTWNSADFVHTTAEAAKLALADRFAWYGDPDYVDIPLAELLSDDYARTRCGLIGPSAAQTMNPGRPAERIPPLPDLTASDRTLATSETRFGIGEPTFAVLPPANEWARREIFVGDTCHLSVIDKAGNMVAATPSGGWLSSAPVIPALGFSLNSRLQMTWLDDGVPGQLQPGKRPSTTLSPGMALRDGKPYMAFGTPGGDQQDQWTVAFFLRHAQFGLNLQEAIDAPSWHVDHSPASFWPRSLKQNGLTVESRIGEKIIATLRAAGHDVNVGDPWSEGRISACTQERDNGGRLILRAAANARGMQGYAVGR